MAHFFTIDNHSYIEVLNYYYGWQRIKNAQLWCNDALNPHTKISLRYIPRPRLSICVIKNFKLSKEMLSVGAFRKLCIPTYLWPLFLTWFNFNPSMDKQSHAGNVWDEITSPFLNFNGCTVEV